MRVCDQFPAIDPLASHEGCYHPTPWGWYVCCGSDSVRVVMCERLGESDSVRVILCERLCASGVVCVCARARVRAHACMCRRCDRPRLEPRATRASHYEELPCACAYRAANLCKCLCVCVCTCACAHQLFRWRLKGLYVCMCVYAHTEE